MGSREYLREIDTDDRVVKMVTFRALEIVKARGTKGGGPAMLAQKNGKTYMAVTLEAPGNFANPFSGSPFPCLIWDHDGRFTEAQRSEVAKELLQAGCRYAVCGGRNCEAWHDAVDGELVKRYASVEDEARDAPHVMTTWHTDEDADDVAFFFVLNTNFDDHEFLRYLVLHVGDGRTKEALEAAIRRYALDQETG